MVKKQALQPLMNLMMRRLKKWCAAAKSWHSLHPRVLTTEVRVLETEQLTTVIVPPSLEGTLGLQGATLAPTTADSVTEAILDDTTPLQHDPEHGPGSSRTDLAAAAKQGASS